MDGAVIAGYPAYDSYRDSGVEWLGDVPAGWAVKKMKYLFRDHSQKGRPDAELLSVTQNQGVVPRSWVENRMVMPSGSLETFKFIERGDFAISLRSFEGGLEYCHHDGIISPAYTVLKSWHNDLEPGYYRYLFKSGAFISELQTSVVGIREGKNISFEELSHSRMPIPPLPEQRAIAGFLDEKCARLDEAVRIKQQQIALLRERKQILIQQAVTRGLNPAAPMKDSGIDWIGQIPAHWDVVPLRRVSRIHAGNGFPVELQGDQDGTIPFMKVSDFSSTSILIASSNNYVSEKTIRSRKWNKVPRGSIVTAKIGEALRKNHRNILGVDAIIDNNCVGFEAVGMSKSYFFWLHKVIDFDWFVNPGAVPSISMQKYKGEKVPNPPIGEQVAIVEHIEAGCAMVDEGIAIKEDQIAALKEYKTSLINAAVTGKIKVA